MKYTYSTIKNTMSYNKPNEDKILIDNNIFIILDGVSRSLENGIYPNPSPSKKVVEILSETICNYIKISNSIDTSELIIKAIEFGNEKVKEYNDTLNHKHKAGAVGIIAIIENNNLYYSFIGDCMGLILCDNKHLFTRIQTELISKYGKNFTADEIRTNICNNINHPYGYGVLDGNPEALKFVESGIIPLKCKSIILSTDGLSNYLNMISNGKLVNMSTDDIINEAKKINDINQDDRSIIKIDL